MFLIESFYLYKRFVINSIIYNDLIKNNKMIVIKHNLIAIASIKFKTKKKSVEKRVEKY